MSFKKSHINYLYRFRDAVKSCRRSENIAQNSIDATKLAIISGIITAETGAGAVTAAGGSVSAGYSYWDSIVERREADRYFAII